MMLQDDYHEIQLLRALHGYVICKCSVQSLQRICDVEDEGGVLICNQIFFNSLN